jgi:hypothetical protein
VHSVGQRRPVIPDGQVGLDCLQCCVTGSQHRPVVRVGRGQGRLLEALGKQPALVGQRPGVATPPGPAVAQQELAQPMAGAGAVFDHVGTGSAQIPDRFLLGGRDADGDQFSGPVQPRQPPTVPPVGLDPVAGALGISEGRSPGSAPACAPAAGPVRSRSGRPRSRLAANGDHQGGQRACAPTPRHEESARRPGRHDLGPGSPPRWCPCGRPSQGEWGKMGDTGHGRLLPYVAPSPPSWMIHAPVTCGTEPAAPC